MVKKILVAVIAVLVVCGMCYAQESGEKAKSAPVKVNNTICPVTGEKVDMKNPVTAEYKGKIYNFCCPMCPPVFNKDPEKYISKMKESK